MRAVRCYEAPPRGSAPINRCSSSTRWRMSPPPTPAPSSWIPGRAACWRRNRSPCVVAIARFRRVKIYTKTGDSGETGLFGGGRVPKDDLRVAAYGAVDETNAAVGSVLAQAPETFELDLLQTIQRTLFTIGAEL